jgi:hypothetical protein
MATVVVDFKIKIFLNLSIMIWMSLATIGFFMFSICLMIGQYYYVRNRITRKTIFYLNNSGYEVIEIKETDKKIKIDKDKSKIELIKSQSKSILDINYAGNGTKTIFKEAKVKDSYGLESSVLIAIETVMAKPVRFHVR